MLSLQPFKEWFALKYENIRLLLSPKFPFLLEVHYRDEQVIDIDYDDYANVHVSPPGLEGGKPKSGAPPITKYDLILNPIGLKFWLRLFFIVGIVSYLPLVAYNAFSKENLFFSFLFFLPLVLYSLIFLLFDYLIYYYHRKKVLFSQIWHKLQNKNTENSFRLWFRKIPQRVYLHKRDEGLAWWGMRKKRSLILEPLAIRMPINISKAGSAQKSLLVTAMQRHFSNLERGRFLFFTGEFNIYLYMMSPLIIPVLIQFFYIIIIFIFLPYYSESGFPSILLIPPAFLFITLSIFYIFWIKRFIEERKNDHDSYKKYMPAAVQSYINYDSHFYDFYDKKDVIVKLTYTIVTVVFSGLIFLISILNSYNPPKT